MNIGVDARELAGKPTGVGRYLRELIAEWAGAENARRHLWTFYAHEPLALPEAFAGQIQVLPGVGGTRWEQMTLARAIAATRHDVFFAPGYTAPLRVRAPVVQTIHDVSFFAHPEWFTFREGARRRTVTRLSARRASIILTDSAFSRQEIVRHLQIPANRVRVIPLGIRLRPSIPASATRGNPPVVLYVGSIFRRRNVDMLVRAFAEHVLPHIPDARLEIVGENRSSPPVDLRQGFGGEIQRQITVREYVDDATLDALYASATVFAFPSEYEGFGFTPLEALSAGVPPVVLDTAVATEVYGAAARYVPHVAPLAARFGDAIVQLITSEHARADLLRHAPDILTRYRWDHTATTTLRALEEAAHV